MHAQCTVWQLTHAHCTLSLTGQPCPVGQWPLWPFFSSFGHAWWAPNPPIHSISSIFVKWRNQPSFFIFKPFPLHFLHTILPSSLFQNLEKEERETFREGKWRFLGRIRSKKGKKTLEVSQTHSVDF